MEFDWEYMTERSDEHILRSPDNDEAHPYIDYSGKQREVADAREVNFYENPKSLGINYRFWDIFHSNFYASVIFSSKKARLSRCIMLTLKKCRG